MADHPRVCGEHMDDADPWHGQGGSSPRVRGTQVRLAVGLKVARIIPACAGNTEGVV